MKDTVFCLLVYFLLFGVTKPITKYTQLLSFYLAGTKRKKISPSDSL